MLAIQKILDSNIECEDILLNNYNTDGNVETTDVGVVDKLEHFVDKDIKVEHLKAFIHCRNFPTPSIPKGKGHPKKGNLEFAKAGGDCLITRAFEARAKPIILAVSEFVNVNDILTSIPTAPVLQQLVSGMRMEDHGFTIDRPWLESMERAFTSLRIDK